LAADIVIEYTGGAFRVAGWKAETEPAGGWVSVFPVYAGSNSDQPLLGSYSVEGATLTFRPRFPLSAGVHYRAAFRDRVLEIDGPPRPTERTTRVERVYPSEVVLPTNTLRLYIYFSAPMSRGEAWQHIRLIDEDRHTPVEMPFLELDQELWDRDNRRLTVLFDPGRIKRGLVPATTIGPAFVEGKHYKLVIDRDWRDARGVGLARGFEKDFRGGPADRVAPAPAKWRVHAPASGTTGPLIITFAKPMDYVLLQRMISVMRNNEEIAGTVEIGSDEREWRFRPAEAWARGEYRVVADNTLEDIAGNHLDHAFDVDRFERVTEHIETNTTFLPFTIR
jgi:hypothetical protein